MKFSVRVKNRVGMIANLYSAERRVQRSLLRSVRRFGGNTRELAAQLCPKRTGFMAQHVEDRYSAGGRVVQVGWWEEPFLARGLPFYPPYVEYGTSRSPAQPSLGPAYREMAPYFEQDVRRAVRSAVRRSAR